MSIAAVGVETLDPYADCVTRAFDLAGPAVVSIVADCDSALDILRAGHALWLAVRAEPDCQRGR